MLISDITKFSSIQMMRKNHPHSNLRGTFCYRAMPFKLKNVGVTYQWIMNKIFKNQLIRIMDGYIDDMLVKSMVFKQHLLNLEEIFFALNHYQMKLNPFKYIFTIKRGKLLGFLMINRGIKPNLEKTQAILDMAPSHSVKKVQCLTRRATYDYV
jgi:hypothetical protein